MAIDFAAGASAASFGIAAYIAKLALDLRVAVARLTQRLDDHMAAHGEPAAPAPRAFWDGRERRQQARRYHVTRESEREP